MKGAAQNEGEGSGGPVSLLLLPQTWFFGGYAQIWESPGTRNTPQLDGTQQTWKRVLTGFEGYEARILSQKHGKKPRVWHYSVFSSLGNTFIQGKLYSFIPGQGRGWRRKLERDKGASSAVRKAFHKLHGHKKAPQLLLVQSQFLPYIRRRRNQMLQGHQQSPRRNEHCCHLCGSGWLHAESWEHLIPRDPCAHTLELDRFGFVGWIHNLISFGPWVRDHGPSHNLDLSPMTSGCSIHLPSHHF